MHVYKCRNNIYTKMLIHQTPKLMFVDVALVSVLVLFFGNSFLYFSMFSICFYTFCQEWEIDQLLQFCRCNFIFLIFVWFFMAKYSTKICPSQKDQLYFKMQGRRSRPSNLLYIYPFQEGHILVEYFAIKNQTKINKMKLCLQNCSSWSISHS